MLKVFLENFIRDAVTCTEHARRKAVTFMDVACALKRQGETLYGFGVWASELIMALIRSSLSSTHATVMEFDGSAFHCHHFAFAFVEQSLVLFFLCKLF